MNISDFSFFLPEELIAQEPNPKGRDQSRLMTVNRSTTATKAIEHHFFYELPNLLQEGDLLILNNSKVIPARLFGKKQQSGGKVEILLLRPERSVQKEVPIERWEVMLSGRNMREGMTIEFPSPSGEIVLTAQLVAQKSPQTWLLDFSIIGDAFRTLLNTLGQIPIPPYIKHSPLSEDELRLKYQTVFADQEGSAAAPTAGLHFSHAIFEQLTTKNIDHAFVTLHVGLGTFAPVKVDDIDNHVMHSEYAVISEETAKKVNLAKKEGRRIVAVGTTSVRTLESFMENGVLNWGEKWTNIFISPGYTFQCVDAIITNFHLPRSTLLMLVAAFAGLDLNIEAYTEAVAKRYRFYSFGDAMLIE